MLRCVVNLQLVQSYGHTMPAATAKSGACGEPPQYHFSAAAFPAGQRVAAWREIFGRTVVNLDIEPVEPASFFSEATVCQLPGLGILCGETAGMHLMHTRQLIKDDDLSFMASPTCRWTASQLGRGAALEPGDGVLMNNAEVGSITLESDARFSTFRVPLLALTPLTSNLDAAVARRIPADNGALKLLVRYLDGLSEAGALADPELQRLAPVHVYDLLAVALGATRDAAAIAESRGVRAGRLATAKSFVRRHLDRPNLRAGTVAAYLGVTPRYVHILFEAERQSFLEYVYAERLDRAHRILLANPARAVGAIALAAGFGDLSHFNRTFRRRFGCTPSDVRAEARARAAE
jgi:AraC-like DNA-binding protein